MFLQMQISIMTLLTALTPHERLEALRQLDRSSGSTILTNKWFVLLGWSVIILLVLLLVAVRQMRKEKLNFSREEHFNNQANQINLTVQERDMVRRIADLSGIKNHNMVFTMRDAFNSGLAKLKHSTLAQQSGPDDWDKFKTVILRITEKLGFSENKSQTLNNCIARVQTSHQIPKGTEVVLTLKKDLSQCVLGAVVIESNEFEMILQCSQNISCDGGDVWIVNFQNGAVTWEFEAITVKLSGQLLTLSHSENIRFVNRRQYPRIAMRTRAQFAVFPIFRKIVDHAADIDVKFYPAEIVEIGGPCVLLKTEDDLSVRQRILLVFELESGLVIQDVGEVRNTVNRDKERLFLIEMVGLSHKEIDKLISLTNQISARKRRDHNNALVDQEQSEEEVLSNV